MFHVFPYWALTDLIYQYLSEALKCQPMLLSLQEASLSVTLREALSGPGLTKNGRMLTLLGAHVRLQSFLDAVGA